MPTDVRRVAVLPLACKGRRPDLTAGRDMLQPALIAELIKTKRFEVVRVSSDELKRLTGRTHWSSGEVLPADFLGALRKKFGCDAVLFCELTAFRATPPLAVGWRLRLVTVRGRKTLWAGDEDFDAGNPEVAAGAERFRDRGPEQPGDDAAWLALNSPRRFAQYSIARLFETLPAR